MLDWAWETSLRRNERGWSIWKWVGLARRPFKHDLYKIGVLIIGYPTFRILEKPDTRLVEYLFKRPVSWPNLSSFVILYYHYHRIINQLYFSFQRHSFFLCMLFLLLSPLVFAFTTICDEVSIPISFKRCLLRGWGVLCKFNHSQHE